MNHIHVTVWEGDLQSYSLISVTVSCCPPVSILYTRSHSYRRHAQFDCFHIMRQNSLWLHGTQCLTGVHPIGASQARGFPPLQAAVTDLGHLTGTLVVWGPPRRLR